MTILMLRRGDEECAAAAQISSSHEATREKDAGRWWDNNIMAVLD